LMVSNTFECNCQTLLHFKWLRKRQTPTGAEPKVHDADDDEVVALYCVKY